MGTEERDVLMWAALLAALVGTASAEYALAVACGFNPWIAVCVPAALDVYTIRAMRLRRDIGPAVIAIIIVNAVSHLVSSNHLEVSVPVVVGVSAIAPLVLWRLHAIKGGPEVALEDTLEEGEHERPSGELTDRALARLLEDRDLSTLGRSTVVEEFGVSEWTARRALEIARAELEGAESVAGEPNGTRVEDIRHYLGGRHHPMVYAITNGSRVKIGTTTNLQYRVSSLALRVEDVIGLVHGGRLYEKELHGRFSTERIGTTEWFALTPRIREFFSGRQEVAELEAPVEIPEQKVDEPQQGIPTEDLVEILVALGEPLPGRTVVVEKYGVSEWVARTALKEAKDRLQENAETLQKTQEG